MYRAGGERRRCIGRRQGLGRGEHLALRLPQLLEVVPVAALQILLRGESGKLFIQGQGPDEVVLISTSIISRYSLLDCHTISGSAVQIAHESAVRRL